MEESRELVAGPLDVAGVPLCFHVEPPWLRSRLLRLFQHFPTVYGQAPATVIVSEQKSGLRFSVQAPRSSCVLVDTYDGTGVETWFKSKVVAAVFRLRGPELLGFHGCAFAHCGAAHLVVGTGGAGKTTLTSLACAAGARYLSDDIIFIETASYQVLPYPILMSIKGAAADDSPHFELAAATVAETGPVNKIGAWIFPHYGEEGGDVLQRLSAAESLRRLLQNLRNASYLGPGRIDHAATLVRKAPAYQLRSTSKTSAAFLLRDLLGKSRGAARLQSWSPEMSWRGG